MKRDFMEYACFLFEKVLPCYVIFDITGIILKTLY